MEEIKLSKRLMEATTYTVKHKPIADIGSDHAYLPINLVQTNKVPTAIAGEVAEGPYNHAKETVAHYQLEEVVDVRLGDGLSVLNKDEELGTIFICGMGGILISEIIEVGLTSGLLSKDSRLVLQPNNNEEHVRKILMDNHYEIIAEHILEENEKRYEIIVAEYSDKKMAYTEEELLFGPKLVETKSAVFLEKWQKEWTKTEQILKHLNKSKNHEKIEALKSYQDKIKRVIL